MPDEMAAVASTSAAAAASAIKAAKRALRKSMAETLRNVSSEQLAVQSRKVADRVLRSPSYAQAQAISVYVNMDVGEVVTDDICRAILRDGKRLYVPLFASPVAPAAVNGPTVPEATTTQATTFANDMVMLRLKDLDDYSSMKMNRWGIKEPELHYPDGTLREEALDEKTGGKGLDLILAPGVAFDMAGGRLGHGKGYYDRYFTRADEFASRQSRPGPVTVALALQEQILPEDRRVPTDERDRILDAIVSPEHCIQPKGSASRWTP